MKPQFRQSRSSDRFWREEPKGQHVAVKKNFAIAEFKHMDCGAPRAACTRLPRQAYGVGRRQKNLGIERQLAVLQRDPAGSYRLPGSVEVGRSPRPIVEKDVAIIRGLGART